MQLCTPHHHLVEPTTTIFRLLTVVLAAVALGLIGESIDQRLVLVGAAYVVATGALWLLAPRIAWTWLVYPMALMDVGAVTAIISLSPASSLALWSLYLFPLASIAAAGPAPAVVVASLSAIGYLGATFFSTGTVSATVAWQTSVLAAATVLITILTQRWLVERQEKRAWKEIAAAARGMVVGDEPDEAAATAAERTRQLVRADRAWVWWCEEDERLRPGVQVGKASEEPLARGELTPLLMHKLGRGVVSLDEFGEPFASLVGDVILLQGEHGPVALLAVCWNKPIRDRALRRQRLRVFAPWAAEALVQAQARAIAREELRRSSMLEEVASELAGTLERQAAMERIVDAAREGLQAMVSLVERSSGRVVTGDLKVTEALTRSIVDAGAMGAAVDVLSSSANHASAVLVASIAENLALIAWRVEPKLDELDIAWLDQLVEVGQAAMERCAEHESLRTEEHRLRASLESLPAPMAIRDAGGTLLFANTAYFALGLEDVPIGEPASTGEREVEVVAGSPPRVFMAVTMPVAEGQYAVSYYREITREREALRAKDELINMVGHELRNPLTSIQGYSQMMARQLGVIQKQVDQLNRLIGDFGEAAKLEGGQLPLKRQLVDLGDVARSAAERFRGASQERRLRLQLQNALPVAGDPVRLGQVLDNLLGNAMKYSSADQEIVLSVGIEDGQVVLSVRDQGVGIAPEDLPHLFDRFYRVRNADTEEVIGSGLGLSIVRDIVTAHGGRVWAESEGRDLGSTFRVSLTPIAPEGAARQLGARRGG